MAPSRRTVLNSLSKAGIASGGIALGSGTGVASREDRPDNIEIKEVTGRKRQRVLHYVQNESEELIRQTWEEYGVSPIYSEATVDHVESEESEGYSVVLPFSSRDGSPDNDGSGMNLIWNTEQEATIYDHDFNEQETITYRLSDSGEIVTAVTEWSGEAFNSKGRFQTASSGCNCPEDAPYECERFSCDNYNIQCIARILGSAGVAVTACAGCYLDPTKRMCGACVSAALNAVGNLNCDPGDDCRTEYECYDFEDQALRNCRPAHPSVDPTGRYC